MIAQLPSGRTFTDIESAVRAFRWRREVSVVEIGSPQRLAPYSLALEAEVRQTPVDETEVASGRLGILHNPAGDQTWRGATRFVSFVHADVEFEMATDPLLADVAWSWLLDALHDADAQSVAASGTVTTMTSRSFGELNDTPQSAVVELRCSWTAATPGQDANHLTAWQELLCQVAGLEPLVDGVTWLTAPGTGQRR